MLEKFLISVDQAAGNAISTVSAVVAVADNSTDIRSISTDQYHYIKVQTYVTHANLGYLGGARFALGQINEKEYNNYNMVAICNVDLQIDDYFFERLAETKTDNIGWIVPSILSDAENKDRNPKILLRPSKRHMQLVKMIYLSPFVYALYVKLVYSKKGKTTTNSSATDIYAGHGSFLLFTAPKLIKACINKFEPFLFCEEHFFAEEMLHNNLKVVYQPQLIIHDSDHTSTSKLPQRSYCKYNRDAIQFIINTYFNDKSRKDHI